jgi:hypothetical protein
MHGNRYAKQSKWVCSNQENMHQVIQHSIKHISTFVEVALMMHYIGRIKFLLLLWFAFIRIVSIFGIDQ